MDFDHENDSPPDLVGVSDQGREGSNHFSGQLNDLSSDKVPITIVTGEWDKARAFCPNCTGFIFAADTLRLSWSWEDDIGQLYPA